MMFELINKSDLKYVPEELNDSDWAVVALNKGYWFVVHIGEDPRLVIYEMIMLSKLTPAIRFGLLPGYGHIGS